MTPLAACKLHSIVAINMHNYNVRKNTITIQKKTIELRSNTSSTDMDYHLYSLMKLF